MLGSPAARDCPSISLPAPNTWLLALEDRICLIPVSQDREDRGAQHLLCCLEDRSFALETIQNDLFFFGGGFLTLLREMPEEDVVSHLATKQGPRSFVLPLIREP